MVRSSVEVAAIAFAVVLSLGHAAPAEALKLEWGRQPGGRPGWHEAAFRREPRPPGISRRTSGGFLLALREVCSLLPATDAHGLGVYNHLSIEVGYAWTSGRLSIGPLLAVYALACGPESCGRLSGLSPGVRGQLDYYFAGPFGVSASANVDWLTGSAVLPAGVAATVRRARPQVEPRMKETAYFVTTVLVGVGVFGCQVVEECWPLSEDGQGAGAGGGPIVPGAGGYGDVPPGPQATTDSASARLQRRAAHCVPPEVPVGLRGQCRQVRQHPGPSTAQDMR